MRYRFEPFTLDVDRGLLRGDERDIAIEPRAFELLALLVMNHDRVVGFSQAYSAIADAIPAELISCLSRLRWLTVVSRGSTFRFRQEDPDLTAIHATLGLPAFTRPCRMVRSPQDRQNKRAVIRHFGIINNLKCGI